MQRQNSQHAEPVRATPNYSKKIETTLDQKQQLRDLNARVEYLTIAFQAVWEFVSSTHGWTEEHLAERMHEIDGRDGRVDGQRTVAHGICSCGAAIRSRARACEFCGTVANRSIIDQL